MATIAETFGVAVQHHQAGNLRQAEQLYRQVLQVDPGNADSLHLLGVLAYQTGNHQQAIQLIRKALQVQPWIPQYYSNLGVAQQAHGQLQDAVASFQQALQLQPDYVDAHSNLGDALRLLGKLPEAVEHCRQAIHFRPDHAQAHGNLGNALLGQGQLVEAVACFRRALQINPHLAVVHNSLGNALERRSRYDEAIRCFQEAVRLDPNYAVAHNNLGNAHRRLNQLDEAVRCYLNAVRLNPIYAEAHNNLGSVLDGRGQPAEAAVHFQETVRLLPESPEAHNNLGIAVLNLGKPQEAATHFRKALSLRPEYAEAHCNLGNALHSLDQLPDAAAHCRQALAIRPELAAAHHNLGGVLQAQGLLAEALEQYDLTLKLQPNHAEAHWNRSLLWLLLGDFERGWAEYEWRWQRPGFAPIVRPLHRWDGTELNGKSILLFAEQGLGDTIHFMRYLPLVKERGGKVIVECQAPLTRLLAHIEGADQIIARGSPLPPFDVQAALLSLPGILHTTLATIPAKIPYLAGDPELVKEWQLELQPLKGFKIGIAWRGSPGNPGDRLRSIPLACFERLAQVPGVQLISLQKGQGMEELADLEKKLSIFDVAKRLDNFVDTAAVIENLDLVISCDTAVIHLAGALGATVWVALPLVPDWRWLLERVDSPWYPTMRLFRQTRYGQWDDVFERMANEFVKIRPRLMP